jgi:hypothetical protein
MTVVELKLVGNVITKIYLNICPQEIGMKCIDARTGKKRTAKKKESDLIQITLLSFVTRNAFSQNTSLMQYKY